MTADTHEAAVARLRETYAALPPGTPIRLAKRTSNLFRFRDSVPKAPAGAAAAGGLDVSAFGHVLEIDPARRHVIGLALVPGKVEACRLGLRALDEEAAWIDGRRQVWNARFDALDKVVAALKRKEQADGQESE